jgi:hypothetical protein
LIKSPAKEAERRIRGAAKKIGKQCDAARDTDVKIKVVADLAKNTLTLSRISQESTPATCIIAALAVVKPLPSPATGSVSFTLDVRVVGSR